VRELRNPAGARVAMTSAEFDLLRALCERPGRVLSRESLLDLTQGRNAGSFERSIDVLVSRIRRKIEPDPQDATMIKTVRSGGYMFTPTVEAVVTLDPDPYPGGMAGIESAQPVRSLTLVGRRTRGYKVDVYREDSGLGIDRRGRRRVLRLGGLRLEWYPK